MRDKSDLSVQEIAILRHSWDAMTVKETAESMRLSERTVKNYRHNIFDKFGVSNVEGMLRQGVERGYLGVNTKHAIGMEWP